MSDFLGTAKFSFSGAVFGQISEYVVTGDDDHIVTKAAKITGSFIATPVFAVAMIVESIVRALLSIPAKLVHLFIPKSHSEGFNEHVLEPLTSGSASCAAGTGSILTLPILNFFPESKARSDIIMASYDLAEKVFEFFEPALNYQFFK